MKSGSNWVISKCFTIDSLDIETGGMEIEIKTQYFQIITTKIFSATVFFSVLYCTVGMLTLAALTLHVCMSPSRYSIFSTVLCL